MKISESIERARRAQQEHEQKHDVQLEMTLGEIEEEEAWREHCQDRMAEDFNERRKHQLELEVGRDPRD